MAIEFSGEYRIAAPQQQVWDALNDPAVLQASIAGCQQLERVSGNTFNAIVVAKVGPISATFRAEVVLSDIHAPHSYVLTGRGQGGAAGFASMQARIALSEEAGQTRLRYTAQADIGGKLASVGSRLVQTVAQKSADDFFSALSAHFAAPADARPTTTTPSMKARDTTPVQITPGAGTSVPAWMAVFTAGLGLALGYCLALLR